MSDIAPSTFRRRLLWVSVLFGLFVLCDIVLFGWLVFRSLSQREIDRVLLDTRQDASELARRLAEAASAENRDLYDVVASQRETRTYLDEVLQQTDIVETVEVMTKDGTLVFRQTTRTTIPESRDETLQLPTLQERPSLRHEISEFEEHEMDSSVVVENIGELGTLRLQIDRVQLEKRVSVLRRELVRKTLWIGLGTLVLLTAAYVCVWLVLKRAQRLEDQAREAERLAYIGTLAAGLAHEIRNPLNSLNLNMQLLQEDDADSAVTGANPANQRLLAITRSEIHRLERLVSDFLSYARARPLEREARTPIELFDATLAVMAAELEARGVTLEVEDLSGGVHVTVDPGQMRQLLLNLLHNSLAATEGLTDRKPRLVLRARSEDRQVALEVEDNGSGLDEESRQKMFEVFFSTRKGGTGLGLPIVQRIARSHDGRLEVESEVGCGTLVRLWLPAAERPAAAPPVA